MLQCQARKEATYAAREQCTTDGEHTYADPSVWIIHLQTHDAHTHAHTHGHFKN